MQTKNEKIVREAEKYIIKNILSIEYKLKENRLKEALIEMFEAGVNSNLSNKKEIIIEEIDDTQLEQLISDRMKEDYLTSYENLI